MSSNNMSPETYTGDCCVCGYQRPHGFLGVSKAEIALTSAKITFDLCFCLDDPDCCAQAPLVVADHISKSVSEMLSNPNLKPPGLGKDRVKNGF